MRILLIEDDRQIADAIRNGLAQSGLSVQAVHDGVYAAEALASQACDVVVLDLGLPGIDGMTLLTQFRKKDPDTPVLILTARDDISDRVAGLNAGADDFLVKPFALAELEARLRALLRRSRQAGAGPDRADLRVGRLRLAGSERRIYCDAKPLEFSPREFAVLELLMQRNGRVVSKAQIQDHLAHVGQYAGDAGSDPVGDTAIEVYVHRVRKKLEGSGMQIVTLRGFGYLLQQA
ncbi:MAG: response regulator transcription factor [Candidatus Protistobacter heckmanni]|nr:response regulator transcription factor [Candidatus Protistobacter heckmanni]